MTTTNGPRPWILRLHLRSEIIAVASLTLVLATGAASLAHAQVRTITVLYSFRGGNDGAYPFGLIVDSSGNLYGTTSQGGLFYGSSSCSFLGGCGTVFKLDPSGNETVLHSFAGAPSDGALPGLYHGSGDNLIMDAARNLYGTTFYGGSGACTGGTGCGTVFKLDRSGNETILRNFTDSTGDFGFNTALTLDPAGNLYGTAYFGGSFGNGSVFKLDPTGNETVLYSFTGGSDGSRPAAGLIMDLAGNLYGTTSFGGSSSNCQLGCGTVFKLEPSGHETVLHSFTNSAGDGANPLTGVIRDSAGNLYGTTNSGGSGPPCAGCGIVFKLDPSGNETILHIFTNSGGEGRYPGVLVMDASGNLYGTTSGGTFGYGTLFKFDLFGNETVLHNFTGGSDGSTPVDLVMDSSGNLYGATGSGGAFGYGTVFKLTIQSPSDFDGDHKSDIAVWRPSNGTWFVIPSSAPNNAIVQQWGTSGDIPVRGDYDGDGKTDFAVFRPSNGTWFIIPSSNPSSPIMRQWGTNGDIPVPGDYDGDGKTDFAVFRPSNGTWFIIPSSSPSSPILRQWGTNGDIPVPGDYDGDGKTDFAVFRPSNGTWYIIPSSNPSAPILRQWGTNGDIPVPGDYDDDGKTDFAVWRPSTGTWFIIPTSNPSAPIIQQWGTVGDIPVPVDYDGDLKTDIAVWRPSNGVWFIIPSSTPTNFTITQWGISTDVPVQKPIGQ